MIKEEQIKAILGEIALQCIKHDINFMLENVHSLDADGLPSSGYFDECSLVVATKRPKKHWLTVLLHEFCHLEQWQTKSALWVADEYGLLAVDNWIKGEKMDKKTAKQAFNNTIALELDCEKRTVAKIKFYELKLSIEEYIQKANAYLFSYVFSFYHKQWYVHPYDVSGIWKKMPKNLFVDSALYFKEYPKYEKLYLTTNEQKKILV